MTRTQVKLPPLYRDLTPLNAERHGAYGVSGKRNFAFAGGLGYAPLTLEELGTAQRFYPIVFSREAPATPLALLGAQSDRNEFVDADGAWREGAYVPGYLRRYPFAFVRKGDHSDERILCADLTSDLLQDDVTDAARMLFSGEAAGPAGEKALELCRAYERATERTRRSMDVLEALDLFQESAIEVKRGERKARVEGFRIISERKRRDLDDEASLGLMRSGAVGAIYAHLFSLANFPELGTP